ncbi:MAG: hypothetical protein QXW97_01290 [Candidatus Pacearchaeota archaeon]
MKIFMKKYYTLIISLIFILLSINFILAINIEISKKTISDTIISDLNKPAIFNITIKNLDNSDNFTIYSLVGIDIKPSTPIWINSGESKTIQIEVIPRENLLEKQEPLSFEYQIKNSKNEFKKDNLIINILSLDNSFIISPEPINPKSEKLILEIKNIANYDYNDLKMYFTSPFFDDYQIIIPMKAFERKKIEIPIDKNKLKVLRAGNFILKIDINTEGKTIKKDIITKFVELPKIEQKEVKEGFIIKRLEITKKNIGNVKETATIIVQKNFFSYLFTTVRPLPSKSFIEGLNRIYVWEKDLVPDDELSVVIITNWLYPIFIISLIIFLVWIIKKSLERDLIFRKEVSFVRTKGGEFALKVSLKIKSKKYIERINIIDKLPNIVNLYEKFGAVAPDKVDMQNKRIEWNIESMNSGEERIFSYIIYSHKIGVIGRFELPSARIVYEKNGKIKEATSNRAFFINEPKHSI